MNKTNIIAMLLLLAAAGTAMADTGNNSSVTLDVNISSECFAVGMPIEVTVEVGDLNGTCDMNNMTVTATFTADGVNEVITYVECDINDNNTTMNCTGNVTIDVPSVNVTCEVVATNLTAVCANDTHVFQMMDTIAPIVIDGGYPGNFMVENVDTGEYDFNATCYTVCNKSADCDDVVWSCSNPCVATINESTGELIAKHAGVAVVTATSDNVSDMVNITVEIEDEEDDTPPATYSRGSSRSGTYPPDDGGFDSDDDSDVVDDTSVEPDEPDVVQPPVEIPVIVETPTTENTLDADTEHPDDDDGVNILWLFAGAVAVIAIGCAVVIKWRT